MKLKNIGTTADIVAQAWKRKINNAIDQSIIVQVNKN